MPVFSPLMLTIPGIKIFSSCWNLQFRNYTNEIIWSVLKPFIVAQRNTTWLFPDSYFSFSFCLMSIWFKKNIRIIKIYMAKKGTPIFKKEVRCVFYFNEVNSCLVFYIIKLYLVLIFWHQFSVLVLVMDLDHKGWGQCS